MFRIFLAVAVVAAMLSASAMGGTIAAVSGDLSWTGAPTPEGDMSWPADLQLLFDEPHGLVQATLTSEEYSGAWTLDHTFTFDSTLFFTDTFNDEVTIGLKMEPLAALSEETFGNVSNVRFEWAHPSVNDPDFLPVSWLTMSGPPEVVPEPSSSALLGIGLLGFLVRKKRFFVKN
jgi:hypothetical protein